MYLIIVVYTPNTSKEHLIECTYQKNKGVK